MCSSKLTIDIINGNLFNFWPSSGQEGCCWVRFCVDHTIFRDCQGWCWWKSTWGIPYAGHETPQHRRDLSTCPSGCRCKLLPVKVDIIQYLNMHAQKFTPLPLISAGICAKISNVLPVIPFFAGSVNWLHSRIKICFKILQDSASFICVMALPVNLVVNDAHVCQD